MGSRIESGMTSRGKPPRWTIAFLRALERTGEVRAAAEDAGVDHTTAYARRKAHHGFAEAWDAALRVHGERIAEETKQAVETLSAAQTAAAAPVGAQLRRAGHDRWSQAKERLFFEELAATANVKRAAAAAGVSANAVYARRLKHLLFRAKWAAVLETGRASIELKLVEAANKTFDPEDIDVGDVQPKVSVAEAIKIAHSASGGRQKETLPNPFAEEAESMAPDELEELRERLVQKLRRYRNRAMPDLIAAGWSCDESHDQLVPPGWVRFEQVTVSDGGPRAAAPTHCPHCGGGLRLSVVATEAEQTPEEA